MNRRKFFAGLLALPAVVKAVANPYVCVFGITKRRMTIRSMKGGGCSLTHASITPLTPADIVKLSENESSRFSH